MHRMSWTDLGKLKLSVSWPSWAQNDRSDVAASRERSLIEARQATSMDAEGLARSGEDSCMGRFRHRPAVVADDDHMLPLIDRSDRRPEHGDLVGKMEANGVVVNLVDARQSERRSWKRDYRG